MKPRFVLHLVPHPTTSGNGISHYAEQLGRELQKATGIASRFLYTHSNSSADHSEKRIHNFPIPLVPFGLSQVIANGYLEEEICGAILIIHYFPFLYEAEVYPHQQHHFHLRSPLAEELRQLKRLYGISVAIFVHEWLPRDLDTLKRIVLRPFERRSLRHLLSEADLLICSNPVVEKCLQRIELSKPIHVCPISSSCGEPRWERLISKVPGSLIVFGADASLRRYMPSLLADLQTLGEYLGVRNVRIAGGHGDATVRAFIPQVESLGFSALYTPSLPDAELSVTLAQSQFLYLDYFHGFPRADRQLLFKSSVWGMGAAHACIPVLADQGIDAIIGTLDLPAFPHRRGQNWIVPPPEELGSLPRRIFNWYQATSSFERITKVFIHFFELA